MGRSLKNYDIYIEKIQAYTEACEITIEYKDVPGDGAYMPSRRVISVDKDLPESTEIATLLHEMGHSMDDTLYDKRSMKILDKAFPAFYNGTATEAQKAAVIECERRAWVFARGIAKKLRIPLGKWFDKEENEALSDYRGESNE